MRRGFRRGRPLEKIGLKAQDTSELFFDALRVPAANLLGGTEGLGFSQLMQQLPQERLIIALQGIGAMERALDETVRYVKERRAFGRAIWDFQNTRFKLAEVQATVLAARAFVDACMVAHLKGELDAARAALVKAWVSEQQGRVMDECLQLFGGYGYMMETPIAELFVDARVQRIYGGTNEIMKELASRSM
jgi:acyl-CoA dehydrogenase